MVPVVLENRQSWRIRGVCVWVVRVRVGTDDRVIDLSSIDFLLVYYKGYIKSIHFNGPCYVLRKAPELPRETHSSI